VLSRSADTLGWRDGEPGGGKSAGVVKGKRRGLGTLESEVLAALWAAERPLTVSEVVAVIGSDLAPNTVHTTLVRLHGKGAVERRLVGRAHEYSAVMDKADLVARKMRGILDQGSDSRSVLRSFVDKLTPEEESTLSEILSKARNDEH
jgi:predicted transcriptional regulator